MHLCEIYMLSYHFAGGVKSSNGDLLDYLIAVVIVGLVLTGIVVFLVKSCVAKREMIRKNAYKLLKNFK